MSHELPPVQSKDLISFYLTTSGVLGELADACDLELIAAKTRKDAAGDEFMEKTSKDVGVNLIHANVALHLASRRREYLNHRAAILWLSSCLPEEK